MMRGKSTLRTVVPQLIVLGAIGWFPVCQRSSAAAEPTVAQKLCDRLWTEYTETAKTGDWNKLAGWFAKDAVLIYPEMAELRGRDAIRAHFQAFQGVRFVSMTFRVTHCGVLGTQAFTFASLDEAYQQGSGPEIKESARCGVVWMQEPDKTWRVSHFLVNQVKP